MKFLRFHNVWGTGEVSSVFRSMMTLATGTVSARLIGIASIPFLTRLYTPADYGVLSVYTALVTLIAPLLTLRYPVAIPLPKRDTTAANLVAFSGFLLVSTSVAAGILLFLFGDVLLSWMSMEKLTSWLWLVLVGAAATALYELLSFWATRRRAYKVIAQTKVLQSALGESLKLVLGYAAFRPFGLLLGQLVSQSGGVSSLTSRFRADIKLHRRVVKFKHFKVIAKQYWAFPIYRLPSQFLLVFSTQAPAMFAAALFGAESTGQLGLALMALAIPSNLIGQSVGQAFYGEIARYRKGSEKILRKLVYSVQARLFALGIPVTITIFFFGKDIFSLAFGNQWEKAGYYAAVLSPYVLLQLTSAPLIQVLNIYKEQLSFLFINLTRASVTFFIYFACKQQNLSEDIFVQLLGAFLFIFYLLVSLYIIIKVKRAADHADQEIH